MIFQMLISLLIFGNTLIACDRGSRLISEAGGAAAIAGTASSANTASLAGAVGISDSTMTPPVQEIPTIPGAPGILDFADFYAVMPADNPNPIPGNTIVQFPNTGSTNGGIPRIGPGTFVLPIPGTYLVLLQASVTGGGQLMLRQYSDGLPQKYTVVGRSTGNTQIVGFNLVTTVAAPVTLEVVNPPGNTSITLTPYAGDSNANDPVTAHLVIIRIQ